MSGAQQSPEERQEELRAAAEAGAIGGPAGEQAADAAQRPLAEAGEGEAEGFEQAERELVEHASHGDEQSAHAVLHDELDEAGPDAARADGEADHEHSTQGEQDR